MGVPFTGEPLSLLDGELFLSHKKKLEEMEEKWNDYPFAHYQLQSKSKKSYKFRKIFSVCSCGRKANLKCFFDKCSRCCLLDERFCKAHKKKKPLGQINLNNS